MYKIAPAFIFAFFLIACGGSEESTDESSDNDVVEEEINPEDTIQIEVDPDRPYADTENLFGKVDMEFDLPLEIDSTWIADFTFSSEETTDYTMTRSEAAYLSYDWVEDVATGNSEYDVSNFMFMDSIKQAGDAAWEAYQNSIDLGQTRYSTGNYVGRVELSNISYLILWSTDYATYEACPYGWGTCVFATLFTKDVATNTLLVGEYSGGGDPPVWGENQISSIITDSTIIIDRADTWGDEDWDTGEEIIETEKKSSEIQITPYGMVVMENIVQ